MTYLLVSVFFFYIGFKSCKVISLLRETRNVKFIEKTIEKILSKDDVVIFDNSKEKDSKSDYEAFLEFKKMQEVAK